jgi:uncharacterized protein (TIGR03000 family)
VLAAQPRRHVVLSCDQPLLKEHRIMKRLLLRQTVPILGLAFLVALPQVSSAGSMRSAGSRSTGSSPAPVFVTPPVFAATSPAAAEEDYAYGSAEDSNVAVIRLRLPANAEVWFDGSKTSQSGSLRPFVTTPLEPGKDYSYEIRARWTQDGRAIEQTRRIIFRPGDRLTLNLMQQR